MANGSGWDSTSILAIRRIRQLRDRGDICWQRPTGKKGTPAYERAVEVNALTLDKYEHRRDVDSIYAFLLAQRRRRLKTERVTPERAVMLMVCGMIDRAPEAWRELEKYRFVG